MPECGTQAFRSLVLLGRVSAALMVHWMNVALSSNQRSVPYTADRQGSGLAAAARTQPRLEFPDRSPDDARR